MNDSRLNFNLSWPEFLRNPLWYVAAVTALTGLTVYLPGWWWLAGLVALVWGGWLVWQMFGAEQGEAEYEEHLRHYLAQALVYEARFDRLLKATARAGHTAQRQHLAHQLKTWLRAVQTLGRHLASLGRDQLIRREMIAVPQAVKRLAARLAVETDPALRLELERALGYRQNQLASLEQLQRAISQADLQLESTLSLLGTIYSQILTFQSTEQVADYQRLSTEVDDEVARLQDQLEALREVKAMCRSYATQL